MAESQETSRKMPVWKTLLVTLPSNAVCVQLLQFSFQYDSDKFSSSPIQWKSSWPYYVPNTFRVLKSSLFGMWGIVCEPYESKGFHEVITVMNCVFGLHASY